jgi:hypothetical protein
MSSPSLWFSAGLISLGLVAAACGNDNPKLLVTGIEPDKGDVAGDTYVRIHGNRFTADGPRSVKVYFGGHEAQIDRFVSDNELIVVAPGGKLNDVVDVLIVFDPGGKKTLPNAFRYVEKGKGATIDDLGTGPDKSKK